MKLIKDSCSTHGDRDLSERDVVIRLDQSHREIPFYEFTCDNHVVRKILNSRALHDLVRIGVGTVDYDSTASLEISPKDIQNQSAIGQSAGIFAVAEAARFERVSPDQLDLAIRQELYSNPSS